MNKQLTTRIALYDNASKSLAKLSNQELFSLLQSTENTYSGIGGKAAILELDGIKIFTKKIPLTALEMQPENFRSTANLFNLPMSCHIGVGSPGFSAWRELLVHENTTKWVLSGQCENFPIMYHWRVLPATHQVQPMAADQSKKIDEDVRYWDNSNEIRNRLEATCSSTTDLLVFLEYIPETLYQWLDRKLKIGGQTAIDAVASVDVKLKQTNAFMNTNGLIHFDAHFWNILADDHTIYMSDFRLSLSNKFDLLSEENELFNDFKSYDNASSITNLLHCMIGSIYNQDPWELALKDYVDGKQGGIEVPIANIIKRYAPIAFVMDEYYKSMQKLSKSTPYQDNKIEHLLKEADVIIKTERLRLRQWRIADIAVLSQINQDPKVMEYFPAPRSYAETETFVLANMDLCNKGEPFLFAVEEIQSSELIGFVGLCKIDQNMPFSPAVEIGWRLATKYWGRGYAFEAASAVVKHAFEYLGITELVSFTVPDNMRSRKLMERLGLVYEPDNDFAHPKIAPDHKFSRHVLYRLRSTSCITIELLKNDTDIVASLKQEVLEFGSNSGVASGLFSSLAEAQQFTTKIIASRFDVNPNQQHCFAIKLEGQIVGRAWLMECPIDSLEIGSYPDMRLAYIKIDEQYQRHGIAVTAIKLLEDYSVALGYKKISLNVFANLPHAKKLYLKLGFTIEHETVKNGRVVTTEMNKSLSTFSNQDDIMNIKVDLLKNHPLTIPALAQIWHEVLGKIWMSEIGIEEIASGYYEELNEDLPLAYVAFYDEIPVGTCTLQLNDGIRPDLKPWLGDLVVDAKYQKRGIGKMLIEIAMKKAKSLGFEKLYLFAFDPSIPEYYQRLGWRKIGMDEFNSKPVTVMEIDL